MHFSSQNLNTSTIKINGKKKTIYGPMWKYGRLWIRFSENWWTKVCIVIGWKFEPQWCLLMLDLGGGDSNKDIGFSIGIPLIGHFYITFERLLPKWLQPTKRTHKYGYIGEKFQRLDEMWDMPMERQIGVRVFDQAIWISLWDDPMEWSNKDPWWWEFTIKPLDILFGRSKYSSIDLNVHNNVAVHLPEAIYPVKVHVFESTWKRPRWPIAKKMIRCRVEPIDQKHGIPSHAGKGENSWDMDDDATFSMTVPVSSAREAITHFEKSILDDRERYGWPSFKGYAGEGYDGPKYDSDKWAEVQMLGVES